VNIVKEYLNFTDRKGNIAFEIALAFFCPFLGFYSVEKSFSQSCAKQGIEHTDTSLVYLILSIFPFGVLLALAFMQVELNKITTILEL
jgi:TRAP-type C4-dicarboxylate transport system permease small subunit